MSVSAPPRPRTPRVRRSRSRVRRRIALVAAASATVVTAGIVLAVTGGPASVPAAQCSVTSGADTYSLTPDQAANAATISSVAAYEGLPDHAVTIALATAFQESKLINLGYGDRDSLGLFQQRPSQGWGTPTQIADPAYASTAFYRALVRLPHWQTDSVDVAAQAVQHSADGTAYAQWTDEARALAIALTGERPAGLTCGGGTLSTSKATTTTTRSQVEARVMAALGSSALTPPTAARGWSAATWLVAHSQSYGITTVSYGGRTWTAAKGAWEPSASGAVAVSYGLARPAA